MQEEICASLFGPSLRFAVSIAENLLMKLFSVITAELVVSLNPNDFFSFSTMFDASNEEAVLFNANSVSPSNFYIAFWFLFGPYLYILFQPASRQVSMKTSRPRYFSISFLYPWFSLINRSYTFDDVRNLDGSLMLTLLALNNMRHSLMHLCF